MPELKKALSRFDLIMIAIGSTIGSGIFLTPAIIANSLHSPIYILIIWFVGGLLILCGALTFAELSTLMPRAGGVYVYLSEGYGKVFGFLYGWAYILVVNTGGIAALSVAFTTYLGLPRRADLAALLPDEPGRLKDCSRLWNFLADSN